VVHRGRDLFAPGIAATSSVAELETQLVGNVAAIGAATARSLAAWVAAAAPAAFERLIHAYLVAVGYRDINWVKRVDGIAYAQATAPGFDRAVLISARSGGAPIDRRGIGELRVGVEAKGLPFGYLFAAGGLSPDAERELERAGRSIAVVCGDALVQALIGAGLGVSTTAVAVRFLDDQFLEDLSAS
jgi:restriction endonuclease Mrr